APQNTTVKSGGLCSSFDHPRIAVRRRSRKGRARARKQCQCRSGFIANAATDRRVQSAGALEVITGPHSSASTAGWRIAETSRVRYFVVLVGLSTLFAGPVFADPPGKGFVGTLTYDNGSEPERFACDRLDLVRTLYETRDLFQMRPKFDELVR